MVSHVAHTERIGVLGGTFDPPHYGHLTLAATARVQLGLTRVIFVPAGQPPHKPARPISDALHRETMVALAIAGEAGYALSRADLDRPGPHYTVDLLKILRRAHPSAELYFLIGSDSLSQLPSWYRPDEIVRQARLAVLHRRGWAVDLEAVVERAPELAGRLVMLDGPAIDVSSTEVRERIEGGLPVAGLAPPAVEEYIRLHRLYQGD